LALLAAALATPPPGQAADPPQTPDRPPRRWRILPLPTVDLQPETGLSGGAVVLTTAQPFANARPSALEVEGTLTTKRQALLETDLQLFGPQDFILVQASFDLLRFPESIWAPGPDSPADSEEPYAADRIELALDLLYRPWASLFVGPSWRSQRLFHVEPTPGGLLDRGTLTGAAGGHSRGLGPAVVWDDRARPLTPAAGEAYGALRAQAFGPALGSDFRFSRLELDARRYLGLGRGLVALQAYGLLHGGDPPFRMLSLLGGESLMRGTYRGRFRDRQLLAAQVELRQPLFWRLAAVAFVGGGTVAPRLADLRLATLKPSLGAGLRLRVDDDAGTNLRLDIARGAEAFAFYLGFGEAF
jgi:hypothetical protein